MRTYNNIIEKKNVLRGVIDRQQTSETSADIVLYINNEPRTITIPIRSNGTFYLCVDDYEDITKIDLANSSYIFEYVKSLELDCPSTLTDIKSILKGYWNSYLEKIIIRNLPNGVTDLSHMFDKDQKRLNNLRYISLVNWDTSNVTDISYMFSNLADCEIKGIENFDTKKVTNMSYVFNTNTNIENINIFSWNTKSVESYTNFMPNDSSITVEYNPNTFSTSMLEEFNNVNWHFVSYIEGKTTSNKTTIKINNVSYSVDTDETGHFYYEIPSDIVIEKLCLEYNSYITDLNLHVDTTSCTDMSGLFYDCSQLKNLNFLQGFGSACENMSEMFRYYKGTTLNLTNLDTSSCTDMAYMFAECSSLTNLILPQGFGSVCESMQGLFSTCEALTFDLTNLDTSSCVDMSYMFSNYKNTLLNLTNLDTSSCTNMSYMFQGATSLTNLTLPQGFGSACENMSYMFQSYRGTTLNLTNLDTSSCTDMSYMFTGCSSLTNITFPQIFGLACENMSYMFQNCTAFTNLVFPSGFMLASKNVSYFVKGISASITFSQGFGSTCENMSYMFNGYKNATLDLTNFDTSSCTNMSYMFQGTTSLTNLTLPAGFGSACENMSHMFENYYGTSLNLTNLDTSSCTNMSYMFYSSTYLSSITFPQGFGSACENMSYMFYNYGYSSSSTVQLNLSNFDTSSCKNMSYMFRQCKTLNNLTLPQGFGHVCENMSYMFQGDTNGSTTSLNLTNLDTSSCKDMNHMFHNNRGTVKNTYLTLTLPQGFGSACENMDYMFAGNYEYQSQLSPMISTLNLTNLDTSSCKTMYRMFFMQQNTSSIIFPQGFGSACKNMSRMFEMGEAYSGIMTSINLSNFDFSSVTDISYMFNRQNKLTTITLPSNNLPVSCTNMSYMFSNCTALVNLTIPQGFEVSCKDMSYMFNKCSSLTSLTLHSGFGHNCTNMSYMFNEANASSIDINDIDTTSCTNMSYMFYKATTNTTITIPQNFGESCTDISYMFNSSSVKLLDIQNFDTKSITTYTGFLTNSNTITVYYDPDNINTVMKSSLSSVKWMIPNSISGKISNSNETFTFKINSQNITVNVDSNKEWTYKIPNNLTITNLDSAFEACNNLTSVSFADVNLSKCISMNSLFKDCINLTQISLQPNFGSACEDMSHMFEGCTSLVGCGYLDNIDTSSCKNLSYLFKDCTNLYYQRSSITISFPVGFGSVCEDMSHMFDGCSIETYMSVAKFDLTNLDTSSCTNMSAMFKNSLKHIYSFTIPVGFGSACEDMSYMFEGCKYEKLFRNNLKNLDTSSCINMEGMFKDFTADSSNYTLTSDVVFGSACTNMSHMFEGFKTSRLNITSIDTSSCKNMSYMFSGWTTGTSLQIASNFGSACEDASYMLKDCSNLSKNIISSLPVITSNSLSNIDGMFEGTSFDELDLNNWNISNIISLTDLFKNCENLTYLDIRSLNTTSINSYTDFIPNESSLTVIYTPRIFNNNIVSEFDNVNFMPTTTISGHSTIPSSSFTVTINSTQYTVNSDINGRWKLVLPDNIIVTSFDNAFDSTPIDSIDFAVFDTSTCISMNSMFNGCTELTEVDLNSMNISACTDISNMFNGCTSLTKLIINKWNTTSINSYTGFIPNVTTLSVVINNSIFDSNIVGAFNNVNWINRDNIIKGTATANKSFTANINGESVTIVSDANGNFSYEIQNQITSLYRLFRSNISIKTVDLSGLDVSNCTDFTYMFQNCTSLTSVDVSKMDMSTCTNISYMFYGCNKLTTLDIRTWNLSDVTTYSRFIPNSSTLTVYYDSTKVPSEIVSSYSSVNWVDVSNS